METSVPVGLAGQQTAHARHVYVRRRKGPFWGKRMPECLNLESGSIPQLDENQ